MSVSSGGGWPSSIHGDDEASVARAESGPTEMVWHSGAPIPEDMEFFAPPPDDLGQVLTGSSTLKTTKTPMAWPARLLIASGIAFGIAALLAQLLTDRPGEFMLPFVILSIFLGLPIFAIVLWRTRFKATCDYVCERGAIRYKVTGSRNATPRSEILVFAEAVQLNAGQTRQYVNGVYSGTNYDYVWFDDYSERLFRLKGTYRAKDGNPKPKDPFHFALSAERAWNVFLSDRLQSDLEELGYVEFPVGKNDAVRVGPGFLEFDFKGKTTRVPAEDIKDLSINDGRFFVRTHDAKLFGSKGKFQFDYNKLGNGTLFVFVLEQLLGYRFD